MADQLNTEEFQYQLEKIIELIKKGIPLSEEQTRAVEKSIQADNKRTDEMNAAFNKLGRGTKDLGRAMLDGKQGMEAMAGGVTAVAGALEFLIAIIPGARLLKIGLTAAVGALAFFTKETGKQADALYKSYQELSKTGQATAGGMTEIYKNMQQFGYNIDQLNQMTALLKENSQALAAFGGTAAQGTKAFADAAEKIQYSDVGQTFIRMGRSVDDINRGTAMAIKNQQSLGITSATINKNLADSAGKYMMQLDLLSRLTGMNADQVQEKLDQANAEQAFNQLQYELMERALAGDKAAEKQYEENQKTVAIMASLGPTFLKEYMQSAGGDISTMPKLMMTAPGAAGMIASGTYQAEDLANEIGIGVNQFRKANGQLAKMNAADFGMPYNELSAAGSRFGDPTAKAQFEAARAQQKEQKENLDASTKNMADTQISQMQSTRALQDFVNLGVKPATDALKAMASLGAKAAGLLPGTNTGVPKAIGGAGAPAGGGGGGATSPTPKSAPAPSGGGGAMGKGADLSGLRIKSAESTAGGETSQQLADIARNIQNKLGKELTYFSAFNDLYDKRIGKGHKEGRALDFTIGDPSKSAEIASMIKGIPGIGYVLDEYKNPKSSTTGGHIHAEISARNGFNGMLTGPSSGYMPNIEMHGREQLSITPANAGSTANLMGAESADMMKKQLEKLDQMVQGINQSSTQDIMSMQLSRLDELVRVMQNQVNVSTKILQQSR